MQLGLGVYDHSMDKSVKKSRDRIKNVATVHVVS